LGALLKRFWTDHRLATVISLALLFLGLLIKPWTLVLVLVVAFGGPLVGRLESLATSPVSKWRRSQWMGLALLLAAVLLALTGSSGGQGALILALLPVAWVLVTDRSILQGSKEDERASLREPLTLSIVANEDESSSQAEAKLDREAAAAEPPERLVGGELLAKIKELGDVGKSDLVRACGYFSQRPDGSERLNFTDFYEALLEAKGFETSSSNSDNEDEEEPEINYDDLWAYFQEGGGDIWNEEETVYLGTFEGDPGTYIIEVNGPDEYEVPYCTGREDLPRIVEAFVENGGAISDLLKAVSPSLNNSSKKNHPEGWNDLEDSEIVDRLKTSLDISAEILRSLSSSNDWEVRQAVAWHENTQADVIEVLAEDEDSDVRRATQERSLPKEWRTKSENEKVAALQSSDVPLEVIQELAASENWTLRQAVAWSPSTPESVLATLKEDEDDDVKSAATEERQLPMDWRFLSTWEKVERLNTETLSSEVLAVLSKSRASDVRRAVALNTSTPEAVLAQLAEDDDRSVQSGVRERQLPDAWTVRDDDERIEALKEEAVPEDVLTILAQSGNWQIRQAVAFSPAASASVLRQLSSDEDTDVQSAVRERNLPEDWKGLDEDEKIERLKKGDIDEDVLAILAKSGRWSVRQAVARNQATPEVILHDLAEDDDSDVSSAAKKALKKRSQPAGQPAEEQTGELIPWEDADKGFAIFASALQVWDEDNGAIEGAEGDLVDHAQKFIELIADCSGCWGTEYLTSTSETSSRPFFVIDPEGDCLFSLLSDKSSSDEGQAKVFLSAAEAIESNALSRNGRVYACIAFTYNEGDSLIEFEDFNREISEDGDEFENIPSIARSMEGDVEVYLRVPESDGDAEVVFYGSWDSDGDLDETEELSFELASELSNRVSYGNPFTSLSQSGNANLYQEDEEHSIYIKTEPGGRISFGSLDRDQISQLSEAIANQELSSELEDLRDNSYGTLNECDGVVNSGDEGDFGNEGSIVFSSDQPAIGPEIDDVRGCFKDGVYVVLMRLSKCSIEFEFMAKGGFDSDEFEEVSVPVRLPEEIVHNLYGHPDFNIITGFRFRGESIDEYEGEVEDRGYDDTYTFFAIRGGKTLVLYSNYNGDEEWCDPEEAKTVLSAFL